MKTLTLAALALSLAACTPAPLAPCATEDSTGCYWDAAHRGNGTGHSFITLANGTTVYLEGK